MNVFNVILDAYPHCRAAIVYCESILDEQDFFDAFRKVNLPVSINKLVELIRLALVAELTELNGIDRLAQDALVHINHPSFRAYLLGKMGAV